MRKRIAVLSGALILLAAASITATSAAAGGDFHLVSTIAFSSTRDYPDATDLINASELYLMNPDGTNPRRLTTNAYSDYFPALSPDGKKIAFDSNRNRAVGESRYTSDLFLMKSDGSEQVHLTRGSSASWAPDGREIAFHASASGTGTPLRTNPGSATTDSDIFVATPDDNGGVEQRTNITNTPGKIDDDADWSPDGQSIVYTAHDVGDEGPNYPSTPFNSSSAEIYVRNADGTGTPTQLTKDNGYEERGPSWSPDGKRIVFACRIGSVGNVVITDFEICVMNADGSGLQQLTDNSVLDLTPSFSPDGQQIVFHKSPLNQLFVMQSKLNDDGTYPTATQLTYPPGVNILANWGELRVMDPNATP